ncbi:MAG: HlyC/CorC family transporter [Cyclobacteriaceae bacterium]|nr:HlyC/CorC family transporter [Cyclobacteriaceae bacterium]
MTAILISLIFSAFFSGIEIAFISSDKLRIEIDKDKGRFSAKLLSRFTKNPSQFIGTFLIGNTLALVVYGIFMANILEPLIVKHLPEVLNNQMIVFILQTILATLIVLMTAEFLPKSIFLINPNQMLNIMALPIWIIYILLYPVVFVIVNFSKFIIRYVLRLKFKEDQPVFGLTDLNNFIQSKIIEDKTEKIFDVDTRIFNNALEFKTVKVRECMIPRPEIIAVDIDDSIETLKKEFIESGLSKILIYRETIDDIIGYCYSLELFKKPKDLSSILTPIIIVPETMPANALLVQFITERKSLALVVDEFGGTSGIVTMEDIIEEIFGEIEDEHDEQDLVEQMLDDHNYLISARLEIDYLNEKYGWDLPEGDYDTIGGFIISIIEDIPSLNQDIIIRPYKFHIVSLAENRINLVKLTILEENED